MRRAIQIAWELGGVLPRSVGALNGHLFSGGVQTATEQFLLA